MKINFQKLNKKKAILLGLVDLHIKTGSPVGSVTLKNKGFDFISSATIRNYFTKLEKQGYLKQQHSSGGRIPTTLAYREYANHCLENLKISKNIHRDLLFLKGRYKKLNTYLHFAMEKLSLLCNGCVFLMAPSFDQDFIQNIKLIPLDNNEVLCVVITDLGQITTEILHLETSFNENEIKLIEHFLLWRINKKNNPFLKLNLAKTAQKIYNEIILRHVAGYSSQENKIYKTGLSNLLSSKEFQDPQILAKVLSLFENIEKVKGFLTETMKINKLTCWIGNELSSFGYLATDCSIITAPYKINHLPVGAVLILLPKRVNYAKIFAITQTFSNYLSQTLSKSIYKFKINFQSSMSKNYTSIPLEYKEFRSNNG